MDEFDLLEAFESEDLSRIREILDADPSLVNARDMDGRSMLIRAAITGPDDIAGYLLDRGADVNDPLFGGFTPLMTAVANRRGNLAKLFVSRGADIHAIENDHGASVLHIAASAGDADIVEFLLSLGVDVNIQKNDGWTPLHTASFKGHLDAAKVLIAGGAQVGTETYDGVTPLRAAELGYNDEMVQFLKTMGARSAQQEEAAGKSDVIDENETQDKLQPLTTPFIDCSCDNCGEVNWGQPDGYEIDIETDWLNLNRVLMCLSCGRKGIIDTDTHKQAAAAAGVDVPDSYLNLGLSAQDYLNSIDKYSEELPDMNDTDIDEGELTAEEYGSVGLELQANGEFDRAMEMYEKALASSFEQDDEKGMASSYGNLGNVYQTRGHLDQALEMYEKALAIFTRAGLEEDMALSYGNIANVYKARGELDSAMEMYAEALGIQERLGIREGMAVQYNNMGVAYQMRGDMEMALEMVDKSLAINKELGLEENMAANYVSLGIIRQTMGDLDLALQMYENALAINRRLDRRVGMANNYGNIGNLLKIRGDLDGALEMLEKSQEICRDLGLLEYMIIVNDNMISIYKDRGDLEMALEMHDRTLWLESKLGRVEDVAVRYHLMGDLYLDTGNLNEAIRKYIRARAIFKDFDRKSDMALSIGNMGVAYQARGDLDKAMELYETALAINTEIDFRENMANNYGNMGNVFRARGELDQALEMYQKTLAIEKEMGNKQGMATDYNNMAIAYEMRGETDKAIELWNEAAALYEELGNEEKVQEIQARIDKTSTSRPVAPAVRSRKLFGLFTRKEPGKPVDEVQVPLGDPEVKTPDSFDSLVTELIQLGSIPNMTNTEGDETYFWHPPGEGVGPAEQWDPRVRQIGEELYEMADGSLNLMKQAHEEIVQNLGRMAGHALSAHWHRIGDERSDGEAWFH